MSDPARQVLTAYGAYGEQRPCGRLVTGLVRATPVADEREVLTSAS